MVNKVSIIVPVYNAEPWIRQCIASLQEQNYQDMEIVFVNDGSTDNGQSLIPRSDDRISISHTMHLGVSAARNMGIKVSTGDLLMFVDADDYLEPDAVQTLVEAIDGVDMVAGSFRKFGEFEATTTHETQTLTMSEVASCIIGNMRNPRSNQLLSGCWAKIYKRSLAGEFPKLTTAEDMAFNFDYLMRCKSVRFIADVVYHNRKRKNSLTTTFDPNNRTGLFDVMTALDNVGKFLKENGYDSVNVQDALNSSKCYHAMLYFMRICGSLNVPMRDAFLRLYP